MNDNDQIIRLIRLHRIASDRHDLVAVYNIENRLAELMTGPMFYRFLRSRPDPVPAR